MTKTKHVPVSGQDKHLQRCGLRDLRGSPNKNGAGKGNWGSIDDEIKNYEDAYEPKQQGGNKIQVIDDKEYEKIKNAK
ncbi:hypothetical protein BCR32DRAFT_282282 [Anaeromyces robustus]|uniref:Hyaluronan/mRNA-binding protein domain-containing protein n=1 Tax=Anaeromyces robustus TaxID=1754192 RepID=A0A1Y1WZC6_9FUNG|nr:hypothetical protein BCR32DRAFT_282282 [Anaeromyces robustus]|eukprot:ORX78444.1 hypothetical protein BCR32DRAFT_282282 [Anaeromyces robustus]